MISSFYAWSFAVLYALAWVVYFVWLVRSRRRKPRYVFREGEFREVDYRLRDALAADEAAIMGKPVPTPRKQRDGVW